MSLSLFTVFISSFFSTVYTMKGIFLSGQDMSFFLVAYILLLHSFLLKRMLFCCCY